MKGYLLLKDGTSFEGELHGKGSATCGELVFNTSMTGYQEVVTDPSYSMQNVVLTFPEIGIYGTRENSNESSLNQASGLIVKRMAGETWHRLSCERLNDFLSRRGITAISGIDTRKLTHHIRNFGPQNSIIAPASMKRLEAEQQLTAMPSMEGTNLVPGVSCKDIQQHGSGPWRIGLLDFGVKSSIINELTRRGCLVYQFPWNTPFDTLKSYDLQGIMLSNGPGDPAVVPHVQEIVTECIATWPTMGICLGFQILALSLGATTYKLPFGHRGGNHPVKDLQTGRVWITAQNHGFAVEAKSLPGDHVELTHCSLFDQSLEGFQLKNRPVFGVQFHPEAGPGPSDAKPLFDRFIAEMEDHDAKR